MYYACTVDMTVLMALCSIAVEQTQAMEKTIEQCIQLLNYLASSSKAKVRFHASDMIMNIHLDASYLSETKACSQACGNFFMGWMPTNREPIQLNGAFYVNTMILHFVVASAAEAELGALFHNCQDGIIFQQTLTNFGHPQPKTPVHCDNATAVGIANNTIKRQQSQAIEMRFFWIGNKVAQDMYQVAWHPGQEKLADYQSKHHMGSHHVAVRPWYLHMENSLRYLPWAERPSTLKGCVGTLKDRYVRKVPLPKAPRIQSASHVTSHGAVTCDGSTPLNSTPRLNSTPLHSTRVQAASRIRSGGHVTSHGPVMHDNVHSTPKSTPLHPTCVRVATRIRSGGHVTSHGPITRDNIHSTPLRSTHVCTAPRIRSGCHVTSHEPVTRDEVPEPDTCYLQFPRVPKWCDIIGSLTGLGRCPRIIPFSPV